MSLGKVKDVIESKHFGMVIKTHNEKFGDGWYLVIKNNAKYWGGYVQFVKLPTGHVNYWDSMINDDVLEIVDMEFEKLLNHVK